MKKVIILYLFILIMVITGCSTSEISNIKGDEKIIAEFLDKYYSQLTLTQDEWDNIWSELESTEKDEVELYSIEIIKSFKEYLTEDCLERMLRNGLIPNFKMAGIDIESISIETLSFETEKDNIYNTTYILGIKGEETD